jgi:two-component system capsular synthesis sensor histidine kinase RcsC
MQKILDRTQASLAEAFASLARNAKRQQYLYLTAIVTLMAIVVFSAMLLGVLAANKQLDYRRSLVTQYAADISLLLHQEVSFLRRTELTIGYYRRTGDVRHLPDGVEASIRQTGVALCYAGAVGTRFDLLVAEATRNAWGSALNDKLLWLYWAGQSTLVTQQAFELDHRAMLVGLSEDYALILPAVESQAGGRAPRLTSADVVTLRETLQRELKAQTGRRVPAKDERLWVGPYVDPWLGVPVMTEVAAYYEGDVPTTLVTMSIPVGVLIGRLTRHRRMGTLLLLTDDRRVAVSSPPVSAALERELRTIAADLPDGAYRYTRHGAILREPIMPGFGSLVGYLPWGVLIAAIGWQLGAIAAVALCLLLGIALTARFWGLRLLRTTNDEAARALENEAINHVLVSATPTGLCIVRQSDYSILTANVHAGELLRVELSAGTLPAHVVAAFTTQFAAQPGAVSESKFVVFAVPAEPGQTDPANEQFLQFTCAPARYAGVDVLFCVIFDVTAQHTLEQQLRAAQQATETTMRARSTFFASMSHEIRTPLNVLLGNLELLSRTPGLETHEQRLRALGTAAEALRRVVNDILDFSKIDAGEMKLVSESFKPIDDLENLALSYAPMAEGRPIRFYSHLSPTLDQVLRGDRTRIAQIINNLLSNAYKFTSCGKITLNAEVREDLQGRSILHCRVCDSGIGMAPALVARIFHPFIQGETSTSSRYGGTGLGLSICANLCELMGGHIAVDSVQGVGSAFSVSIPLALPPEDERVPAAAPTRRGNAMVLCQETESGQIIDGWLGSAGWFTRSVGTLSAAEDWLRANRPDVLVVTGEHGLEIIAALRALQPANVVWITRTGPHRPTPRSEGVFEVSEFSHVAILAAVELAANKANKADGSAAGEVSATSDSLARVPLSRADVAAQPAASGEPALLGLAILVAEDNPLNQALIVEQLKTLGCEPILAGDGRQALAVLEHTEVDVVLTDIHMPVMDGYELLATLRRQYPGLPVLAFSAVTDTQQTEEWRQRGFSGYIPKPTSLGALEAALGALGADDEQAAAARESKLDLRSDSALRQAPEPQPAAGSPDAFDAETKARYVVMLKEHLSTDLPRLSAIVEQRDRLALRDWAHSAGGAFLIVGEPQFAGQCRELQTLCQQQEQWSGQMAALAIVLHEGLRHHFGFDEASMH